MKRLRKRISTICLICAAVMSLMLGASLPRIQNFSADTVAQLFPVRYSIEYRNSASPSLSVASVQFVNETAIVNSANGKETIPMTDAVFICQENTLLAQNTLRSGLLTAFIMLTIAFFPIALAMVAFSLNTMQTRRHSTKRCLHSAANYRTTASIPAQATASVA